MSGQETHTERGLTLPTQERPVSRRAAAIARELRAAARQAALIGQPRRRHASTTRPGWFRLGLVLAFLFLVVVPTLLGGIYFGFVASDQYVSEARFAVRGPDTSLADVVAGVSGLPGLQQVQDSYIVADYIRSRRMVEDLEASVGFRARYGRQGADWLARLDKSWSIEDMVRYWRWRAEIRIDLNSGLMTLRVKAFSREDSLAIASEVVRLSERLVNELSERARQDALAQAKGHLAQSEQVLRRVLGEMRDARNVEGTLDASKAAEALLKLASEAKAKLLALQQDYQAAVRTVSPEAPQMKILRSRIDTLQQQIKDLEGRIASTGGKPTLSGSQEVLGRTGLALKAAEEQYALAVGRYEMARLQATTQQAYLVVFVQPRLADESLYPRRWLYVLAIFGASLLLWAALAGISVLVHNNVAR